MRQLKQRIAELEAENAQLKANQQQQINQPRPPVMNQPRTNKTCNAGHPLNYKTSAFPRYCNGRMGTGQAMRCDLCRTSIRPQIGYFRCDSQNCDYDICARCALHGEPAQVPVNQVARAVPATCCQNHPLIFYQTG